jgi:hypothetical protein
VAFAPYGRAEAELAIRKALDGATVFETSTQASAPAAVRDVIQATADALAVEVVLRLAPNGVLIARAERAEA